MQPKNTKVVDPGEGRRSEATGWEAEKDSRRAKIAFFARLRPGCARLIRLDFESLLGNQRFSMQPKK